MSKKYPVLSDKRPLNDAFVRDASGFVQIPSAITVIMVIKYNNNGFGEVNRGLDNWTIKSQFKAKLIEFAVKTLKKLLDRWDFDLISAEIHKT